MENNITDIKSIYWAITSNCTLDCSFCFFKTSNNIRKSVNENGIFNFVNILKKHSNNWKILLSGGEPFTYSNINYLSNSLINNGNKVAFFTNLTLPSVVIKSLKEIDNKGIDSFITTLHPYSRSEKSIIEFIHTGVFLKDKGFDVIFNYIVHPSLTLYEIEKHKKLFNKYNLKLRMKPFKGKYLKKKYPLEYDKEYLRLFINNGDLDNLIKKSSYDFYNKKCFAGKNYLRIDVDGNITRCSNIKDIIGNAYSDSFLNIKEQVCTNIGKCNCCSGYHYIEDRTFENDLNKYLKESYVNIDSLL